MTDDLKTQLDALALEIAKQVSNTEKPLLFDEKLDAFKALTSYHLGNAKMNNSKKSGEGDKQPGETFDDIRKSAEAGR